MGIENGASLTNESKGFLRMAFVFIRRRLRHFFIGKIRIIRC